MGRDKFPFIRKTEEVKEGKKKKSEKGPAHSHDSLVDERGAANHKKRLIKEISNFPLHSNIP